MSLDINSLQVESFDTSVQSIADPFCCTGCVSGCGINPTAGGCPSSEEEFTVVNP